MIAETVLGAIPDARIKTGLFSSASWVLVVTNQRLLGALVPDGLMKYAVEQARAQARAYGRGQTGGWVPASAGLVLAQRYCAMAPQAILSETPGNWALWPGQVNTIKVERSSRSAGDEAEMDCLRIVIETPGGKGVYDTTDDKPGQREAQALLAMTFGPAVR
jgi:hypothetical protein